MNFCTHQGRAETGSAAALGGGVRLNNPSALEAQSVPNTISRGSRCRLGIPVATGLRLDVSRSLGVAGIAGSWFGSAGHGSAGLGRARRGVARQGPVFPLGHTGGFSESFGMVSNGSAKPMWLGAAGPGRAGLGEAWHGRAGRGMARVHGPIQARER